MPLGMGKARDAAFLDEVHDLGLFQLLFRHRQGGDHLEVRQGHVPRPGGKGDLGDVELGGVLIHVGEGEPCLFQGGGHQGPRHRLGRGPRPHRVLAQGVQAEHGRNAVFGGKEQGEVAQAVLQGRKRFFHVVPAVHEELRDRPPGDHHAVLPGPCGHLGGGGDDGVHGTGTKAPDIAAAGVHAPRDLRHGFGKVAAAALVHVPRRLFGTLDDEIHLFGGQGRILQEVQEGKHSSGLTGDVLQKHIGLQAFVHLVPPTTAPHHLPLEVHRQGVGLRHFLLDLLPRVPLFQPGQDVRAHQGMDRELLPHPGGKGRFQPEKVEDVADVHEAQKLVLGHDFAKGPKAGSPRQAMIGPGRGVGRQGVQVEAPDVGLVRGILPGLVIALKVARQGLQELRFPLGFALHEGGVAVVISQLGGVVQTVGIALDGNFGHGTTLLFIIKR
ncbi:MAG: hypothetical protein BWY88_00051 [Synergistetes bacterium ADurb.Bin520]|nr:MAG: hypothetical protein BWY88_00051 [Synergistetes bacterium ADurb.Bin520]